MLARAQGDRGSLTTEFPKLSAKERSRIAAKEVQEAQQDSGYQAMMNAGEKAFQEGRYEDALARYEQARALRPYNVYPKVKIEDLRALIAKKAARDTVASAPPPKPEPPPPVQEQALAPPPQHAPEQVAAPPAPKPLPTRPHTDEVPAKPAATERPAATPPVQEVRPAKADGVIERRYQEGHAFVIERVVHVDDRVVVYKRVFHGYGSVFYFEDGQPVDERVWNARFPEK